MLAAVSSATLLGVTGLPVTVEVHVGPGMPGFQIVGLPDEACRESRDRVRAAVLSSEIPWPSSKRITVNLAPSHLRKGGSGLDLAIAVGVLVADDVVPAAAIETLAFLGELGLDGSIRPVAGVAPMAAALAGRARGPRPQRSRGDGRHRWWAGEVGRLTRRAGGCAARRVVARSGARRRRRR